MKRAYTRPDILFEDFSLSTAISANCGFKTNTPSLDECGLDFGGDIVFLMEVSGCTTKIEDNGVNNGLCYHTFADTSKLFNS